MGRRSEPGSRVLRFPTAMSAPAAARAAIEEWLGDDPGRDRVVLAASELVSNVVRHAPDALGLELRLLTDDVRLRIEVSQVGGAFHPGDLHLPPDGQLEGRGLPVVDAVADRWGVATTDGRTTVWAEFEVGRGPRGFES